MKISLNVTVKGVIDQLICSIAGCKYLKGTNTMSDMVFCHACSGQIHSSAPFCPKCGAPQFQEAAGDGIPRTFSNSIRVCFSKYATFAGRAPRAEYWYWSLFTTLSGAALGFLAGILNVVTNTHAPTSIVNLVLTLFFLLPNISVAVRRLHDLDKSGGWFFLAFLPVIGWIILLVWVCTRGTNGANRFGPDQLRNTRKS